ncbi:hypothetical protein Nepgr_019694 [Nepenthes gracilis]|uniref:Uncharacterized protein n=1 Tax=Nepenthes gracilis TaxID=150966 RepID=A0AAD3STX5_NEPGR|nr:hypothetical protein Nepgr_019694 [Nepenthes gracilis]
MVKLATAREIRLYGSRRATKRSESMNAGIYFFSAVLLLTGFAAQFSREPKSGLALLLIAFALIAAVNLHDLVAHLAGIDYRLPLVEFDTQLVLVEFAVPIVQALGSFLSILGILFLFLQEEKGYAYVKLERHALNLVIAGPVLWLVGSIHNGCQIYERAEGQVQILQESVHIPFLMGSLLFVVGGILNSCEQSGWPCHGIELLGRTWVWLGIFGSTLLLIGGMFNVVKVFKMQQNDGLRLENLRGGAQERLVQEREGRLPLIIEEHKIDMPEPSILPKTPSTSYKDVLLGQS